MYLSRVSKSYVPFTCKFPKVMHFVPIFHKRYRSKTNFYVFGYDQSSLIFCGSFRFFDAVYREIQNNLLSELYEKRNRQSITNNEVVGDLNSGRLAADHSLISKTLNINIQVLDLLIHFNDMDFQSQIYWHFVRISYLRLS